MTTEFKEYDRYEAFDPDIIMHINSVFTILTQLGVGPEDGFSISDKTATWSDYLGDSYKLELVKSYIYLKVRLMFDPPSATALIDSMNRMINEYEWRLNAEVDPGKPQTNN